MHKIDINKEIYNLQKKIIVKIEFLWVCLLNFNMKFRNIIMTHINHYFYIYSQIDLYTHTPH